MKRDSHGRFMAELRVITPNPLNIEKPKFWQIRYKRQLKRLGVK